MNHWTLALFSGLLTGLLALLCGGFVAAACVSWYRVSSFEGQSAYFVVGLAVLSGLLGFAIGAGTALVVLKGEGGTFTGALGWSSGAVVVVALLAAGGARLFADVAPRIGGDTLTLESELRLPQGQALPGRDAGYSYVKLFSIYRSKTRSHWNGAAHLHLAREEDGHWIVPGEVEFFTMKGRRSLVYFLGGSTPRGFFLPLPPRPDASFLEWSEWIPDGDESGEGAALRFRLTRNTPPPSFSYEEHARLETEAKLAAVADLDLEAPFEEWLRYLGGGADDPLRQLAVQRLSERPGFREELATWFIAEAAWEAAICLKLVDQFEPDAEIAAAVAAVGVDLSERIRDFNATEPEEDSSYLAVADISQRFSAWIAAARFLRETGHGDFVPELGEILELSRQRPDCIPMRRDVRRIASHYLHQWAGIAPHPDDSVW